MSRLTKLLEPHRLSIADWWLIRTHPDYETYAVSRLPPLQGDLPSAETGIVVFCGADPVYFDRFAGKLATSLAASGGSACLHVHLFGSPESVEKTAGAISRRLGPGRFTITFEEADLSSFTRKERVRYFQSVRFARLLDLATRIRASFLAVDIDALFLGPCEKVMQLIGDADIGLRMRPGQEEALRLHAGILCLADTAGARTYLKRAVARMLLNLFHGPADYYLDQRSLFRALKASPDVKVKSLPPEAFSPESSERLMFFGKGTAKYDELPKLFSNRFGHLGTAEDLSNEATGSGNPAN